MKYHVSICHNAKCIPCDLFQDRLTEIHMCTKTAHKLSITALFVMAKKPQNCG